MKLQQQGDGYRAGRPGGRRARLLGRRIGFQRLGQSRPAVHQPEAARRARRAERRAWSSRAAAASSPPFAGIRVFMFPAQDVRVGGRQADSQYQFTLWSPDIDELQKPGCRRYSTASSRCRAWSTSRPTATRAACRPMSRSTGTAAARLGVRIQDIDNALNNAFSQRQISTIYTQRNQYRVILEVDRTIQRDPTTSRRIYVPGAGGAQVPLSAVARIERGIAPLVVNHQGQFPSVTITLQSGARRAALEDATARDQQAVAEMHLPDIAARRFRRRRPGLHGSRRRAAAADARGADRGLYRARRALREPGAPADDHLDAALGRARRAARAAAVRHRADR